MTSRTALVRLPNLLSCSRIVLAGGFVAFDASTARVGIIGAAAVTDFLDGWLARRVHATSRWGALLDPIADRVFVLTCDVHHYERMVIGVVQRGRELIDVGRHGRRAGLAERGDDVDALTGAREQDGRHDHGG